MGSPVPPVLNAPVAIRDLRKSYGRRDVLAGVTFDVRAGETLCLLGRNGAGKTTTVEILAGLRSRDGGEVRVLGMDPAARPPAGDPRVGVMLQEPGAPRALRAREVLALVAAFHRAPEPVDELLAFAGLERQARTLVSRLSGGERQRLSLAMTLVGRPSFLFLDEPTAGMDVDARRRTLEALRARTRAGASVLLTTHALEDAEALADRIAVLHAGRIVALDTPAALVARHARAGLWIETDRNVDARSLGAVVGASVSGEGTRISIDASPDPDLVARVTAELARRGVLVRRLRAGEGSLESAFLALTGSERGPS